MTPHASHVDAIFVHELPITATPSQLRILDARFEAARLLYNALLHESLRRSQLVRESRDYRRARETVDRKLRRAALRKVDAQFEFTRYGLYGWASRTITGSWLSDMSTRNAFAASQHALRPRSINTRLETKAGLGSRSAVSYRVWRGRARGKAFGISAAS